MERETLKKHLSGVSLPELIGYLEAFHDELHERELHEACTRVETAVASLRRRYHGVTEEAPR